ncbi:collagen alpha-1(I) chain-like [Sarcophilus harrisii]|uniref:collagen alpha-1(I) chain-like n=1 Tax=Sarcophilus harrisii TaxID=9305 RepID=UPI001301A4E3|nr:collagen alpha-1(I) chain-like [Sarcophilus harrisii]
MLQTRRRPGAGAEPGVPGFPAQPQAGLESRRRVPAPEEEDKPAQEDKKEAKPGRASTELQAGGEGLLRGPEGSPRPRLGPSPGPLSSSGKEHLVGACCARHSRLQRKRRSRPGGRGSGSHAPPPAPSRPPAPPPSRCRGRSPSPGRRRPSGRPGCAGSPLPAGATAEEAAEGAARSATPAPEGSAREGARARRRRRLLPRSRAPGRSRSHRPAHPHSLTLTLAPTHTRSRRLYGESGPHRRSRESPPAPPPPGGGVTAGRGLIPRPSARRRGKGFSIGPGQATSSLPRAHWSAGGSCSLP